MVTPRPFVVDWPVVGESYAEPNGPYSVGCETASRSNDAVVAWQPNDYAKVNSDDYVTALPWNDFASPSERNGTGCAMRSVAMNDGHQSFDRHWRDLALLLRHRHHALCPLWRQRYRPRKMQTRELQQPLTISSINLP